MLALVIFCALCVLVPTILYFRNVRLFDPAKMPTPGQLNSRIVAYQARSEATYPDASQQLSEALAELRRSLR